MLLAESHKSPIAKRPLGIAGLYAPGLMPGVLAGSTAASRSPGAQVKARPDSSLDHQNVYFAESMTLRGIPGWPVRIPNELSWLNMLR
jgi:hypothetical protein